ncbi:hypothetical protein PQX77_019840 [Marasmius sp. AFHP31]|nr:hypothetical protein PQX77_019840 [Marasmius sp. AFHP31]
MKLFTVAAVLTSMATLTSAAPEWRVRLYERTGASGGSNVDVRGPVGAAFTTTVGGVPTTCVNVPSPTTTPPFSGDRSLRFEDDSPNTDRLTIWTVPGCPGTGATTITGATSIATLFPASPTGALSFKVNA